MYEKRTTLPKLTLNPETLYVLDGYRLADDHKKYSDTDCSACPTCMNPPANTCALTCGDRRKMQ